MGGSEERQPCPRIAESAEKVPGIERPVRPLPAPASEADAWARPTVRASEAFDLAACSLPSYGSRFIEWRRT